MVLGQLLLVKMLQLQDMQQAFICVDGIAYSLIGLEETLLDDNGICENLKKDNAVVFLPIYPNPAESQINLSILVSENADVSLNLFDAQGRWVREVLPKENLDPGIYAYNLSLQGISSGSYTVQMRSGDQVTIQSLLVQQ